MVYWDGDGRKDLLVGRADGMVAIYLNTGTEASPEFDGGTFLQVGPPGSKASIDVGARATPVALDWNNDARKDLVIGAWDGYVRVFINEGTDTAPVFVTQQLVQDGGGDLLVPSIRSSPSVVDWDDDGKKDLLLGNTNGQLLFYTNSASDSAPGFSGYVLVTSDAVPIDLPGTPRSRPFVCDWTGDGFQDVLVGSGDGLVRLYEGSEEAAVPRDELTVQAGSIHLLPAYPNPFNPRVTIPFALSKERHIRLSVHDVTGRRVALVVDGHMQEGLHRVTWDGLDDLGQALPSGVYFIDIGSPGPPLIQKLLLLR